MNFPITDSLALQIIKELIESKYGRKVIGTPTPIIVTDFNTIKSGWDADQNDYVHFASKVSFLGNGGNQFQNSGETIEWQEVGDSSNQFVILENFFFQYLQDTSWDCFHLAGYRYKLEPGV